MDFIKQTFAQRASGVASTNVIKAFDGERDETIEKMNTLMRDGFIESLDVPYQYEVYRFRPNLVHVALAFRTDYNQPGQYFTLGLTGEQDDATSGCIKPEVLGVMQGKDKFHIDYATMIHCRAAYLCDLTLNLLSEFGPYNVLSNNCQDFANALLIALGHPEVYEATDPDVLVWGNQDTTNERVSHHVTLAEKAVEKTRQQERDRVQKKAIGFEFLTYEAEEETGVRSDKIESPAVTTPTADKSKGAGLLGFGNRMFERVEGRVNAFMGRDKSSKKAHKK